MGQQVKTPPRVLFTWHGLMIAAAVAGLAALAAVLFLPLTPGLGREWARLSRTGQEYQAVSTLISSLALVGVAVSLLLQARAGHTAREQTLRNLHQQLIKMAMDDPALMTAMGAPWGLPIPAESQRIREHMYLHMWTLFLAGAYAVGEMTEISVRLTMTNELFNSAAGRTYWANVRGNLLTTSEGKYLRFAQLVDQEYLRIVNSNIPVAKPIRASGGQGKGWHLTLTGAALAIGVLAGRELGRRAHPRR